MVATLLVFSSYTKTMNSTISWTLWPRQASAITLCKKPSLYSNNRSRRSPFPAGLLSTCDWKLSSKPFRNFSDLHVAAIWYSQRMSGKLKSPKSTKATNHKISHTYRTTHLCHCPEWTGDNKQTWINSWHFQFILFIQRNKTKEPKSNSIT